VTSEDGTIKRELAMTVTLNLPPDVEAGLLAQARSEGLAVADYVQNLVRKEIAATVHAGAQPVGKRKRLSELFAVLQGVDIDLTRNPSMGRAVNL